jgi:hypothetical protein
MVRNFMVSYLHNLLGRSRLRAVEASNGKPG